MAAEPAIHSMLVIAGSLAAKGAEIAEVMEGLASRSPKPVCVSWPSPPIGIPERLAARAIYSFLDPVRSVQALARLAAQRRRAPSPAPRAGGDGLAAFDWARTCRADRPVVVPEDRCHRILAAAGLAAAAARLVPDEGGAPPRAAEALGFPVVLKGISPSVTHRAAAGLLAVDLRSPAEVAAAARRLLDRAREIGAPSMGSTSRRCTAAGRSSCSPPSAIPCSA